MFNQGFTKSIIAIATFFTLPVVAEQIATETEIEHIAIWSTQVQTSSLYLNEANIINKQATIYQTYYLAFPVSMSEGRILSINGSLFVVLP